MLANQVMAGGTLANCWNCTAVKGASRMRASVFSDMRRLRLHLALPRGEIRPRETKPLSSGFFMPAPARAFLRLEPSCAKRVSLTCNLDRAESLRRVAKSINVFPASPGNLIEILALLDTMANWLCPLSVRHWPEGDDVPDRNSYSCW